MANIPAEQQHCRWHGMRVFNAKGCPVCFPEAPSSNERTLLDQAEALLRDFSEQHVRDAPNCSCDRVVRLGRWLEERRKPRSGDETPADGHRVRSLEWELRRASYRFNWLADHHLTTDYAKTEARKLADEFWKAQESPEKTSEHAPSCALLIHGRECNCKWIPDTRGSEP
jgi:hypothetical protein